MVNAFGVWANIGETFLLAKSSSYERMIYIFLNFVLDDKEGFYGIHISISFESQFPRLIYNVFCFIITEKLLRILFAKSL